MSKELYEMLGRYVFEAEQLPQIISRALRLVEAGCITFPELRQNSAFPQMKSLVESREKTLGK